MYIYLPISIYDLSFSLASYLSFYIFIPGGEWWINQQFSLVPGFSMIINSFRDSESHVNYDTSKMSQSLLIIDSLFTFRSITDLSSTYSAVCIICTRNVLGSYKNRSLTWHVAKGPRYWKRQNFPDIWTDKKLRKKKCFSFWH